MSFWSDPIGSISGTLSSPKGIGELALGALAVGTMNPELLGLGGAGADFGIGSLLSGGSGAGAAMSASDADALSGLTGEFAQGAASTAAPVASGDMAALGTNQVSALGGANPYAGQIENGFSQVGYPTASNVAGSSASATLPSGAPNPLYAEDESQWGAQTAAQGANAQATNTPSMLSKIGSAASSAGNGLMNFVHDHPYMSAAAALAAYSALGGTKPNYMPTYQPPSAASYGLGRTLAAGYQPYRAAAQGGIMSLSMGGDPGQEYPQSQLSSNVYHAPTQLPTSANQMVGYEPSNLPMSQAITNSMASGGMTAAGESSGPLQVYQAPSSSSSLQDLASQYGISLPSNITAAQGGIMGLASGGQTLQQMYSAQGADSIDPKTGVPYNQEQFSSGPGFLGGIGQSIDGIGQSISNGVSSIGRSLGLASGGDTGYNLGSYSDGGRLLKGPGDGMSDDIPASIADKQPARLAEGEFVVPSDVVSHLGNGSTDAGAKHLYAMMDKVRKARTGHTRQGKQIDAEKYIPT